MTYLEAVLLGVVQGLTEFLPISSSGHLVIVQHFLRITDPSLLFETVVHLGTLFSVVFFFREKFRAISLAQLKLVAIGTLPLIFIGILAKYWIESSFSSLLLVSINLGISGVIMLVAQYLLYKQDAKLVRISIEHMTWHEAIRIGVWQAFAILPGISRSGSTVTGGLAANLKRETAFEFSFYLSVPAIIGAVILQIYNLWLDPSLLVINAGPYLLGGFCAFSIGMLSLKLFKYVIQSAKLNYFGFYCLGLSCLLLIYQFA